MKSKLSIPNVLSQSWRALTSQFWVLVGLFIAYIIIVFTINMFSGSYPMMGGASALSGGNPMMEGVGLLSVISWLLSLFIQTMFMLGYIKNCLDALDGEEPQFSAYGQFQKLLPALGAYLLMAIPAAVILVVAILSTTFGAQFASLSTAGVPVPSTGPLVGIILVLILIVIMYFSIRFGFYIMFIVEEGAGVLDSLGKSWNLTKGHVGELLLLIVVAIGIFIGGVICLGVGMLVAVPLIYVIMCAAYRQLKAPVAGEIENGF